MIKAHLIRTALFAASLAALAATGCVERKLTIASDPPGALTYVNDVEVGRTPVTIPFQWYGDYDIRFRLERTEGPPAQPTSAQYELHTHRRATAPWFQWLGVDLFAEITPFEFKDEKVWGFNLPKVPQESDEQLIKNAKALQAELTKPTNIKRNAPPPTTAPAPQSPAPK